MDNFLLFYLINIVIHAVVVGTIIISRIAHSFSCSKLETIFQVVHFSKATIYLLSVMTLHSNALIILFESYAARLHLLLIGRAQINTLCYLVGHQMRKMKLN